MGQSETCCSCAPSLHVKKNKACRELFSRLVEKGKSKKLALIAVANKLIKQALAIAKNGGLYNENYQMNLQ